MTNEEIIYDELKELVPNVEIKGGKAYIAEIDLTVEAVHTDIKSFPAAVTAAVFYSVSHPLFDEAISEVSMGMGADSEGALRNSAELFIAGVLSGVISALCGMGYGIIESAATGRTARFRMPSNCAVLRNKNVSEEINLWKYVSDIIPQYLGTKNAYWIKLYACWTGKEAVFEASVNNRLSLGLGDRLEEYINKSFDKSAYGSQKEFILLLNENPEEARFSAAQVKNYAHTALDVIKRVENLDVAIDVMYKMCGDMQLAAALCGFIPEIYTNNVLGLPKPDELIFFRGGEERGTPVKISAVRYYGYIENAVDEYFATCKPDESEKMKLLSYSSTLGSVKKAIANGAKMENMMTLCGYNVPEDYVII